MCNENEFYNRYNEDDSEFYNRYNEDDSEFYNRHSEDDSEFYNRHSEDDSEYCDYGFGIGDTCDSMTLERDIRWERVRELEAEQNDLLMRQREFDIPLEEAVTVLNFHLSRLGKSGESEDAVCALLRKLIAHKEIQCDIDCKERAINEHLLGIGRGERSEN